MDDLFVLKAKLVETIHVINKVLGIGRPTIENAALANETILIASLQNGLNITQACLQAGIRRDLYYSTIAAYPEFSDKMEKAEQFGSMAARRNIIAAIQAKDPATSKWYLERKDPDFKPKTDLTTDNKPLKTALVEFVGDDGTTENKD